MSVWRGCKRLSMLKKITVYRIKYAFDEFLHGHFFPRRKAANFCHPCLCWKSLDQCDSMCFHHLKLWLWSDGPRIDLYPITLLAAGLLYPAPTLKPPSSPPKKFYVNGTFSNLSGADHVLRNTGYWSWSIEYNKLRRHAFDVSSQMLGKIVLWPNWIGGFFVCYPVRFEHGEGEH